MNPRPAINIGPIFLCCLKYDEPNDAIAIKTLKHKMAVSKLSDSKKVNPAKGKSNINKGVNKQCTPQITDVHTPSLSRFGFKKVFILVLKHTCN